MSKKLTLNGNKLKQFDNTPVVNRRSLRKGQATLYDLLTDKLAKNTSVSVEEAREIWLTQVCRNMVNDKPHSYVIKYNHDKERWYGSLEPMDEEQVNIRVLQWLTQTIGILVMRGYLKVIPMVKLV